MRDENKQQAITATAILMQELVKDRIISIDTIIIQPDRVILSKGVQGEDDYRELDEILIDAKDIEKFHEELNKDTKETNDAEQPKITVKGIRVRGKYCL